ncbi:MAG: VapE domain-containing protein [Oscillospiraceae bacterium]
MGEMASPKAEQIKQFVSKQSIATARRMPSNARAPGGAFFGTTNDDEFLRDATGGRRFGLLRSRTRAETGNYFTRIVDQVWAEIMVRYNAGRCGTMCRSRLRLEQFKTSILK